MNKGLKLKGTFCECGKKTGKNRQTSKRKPYLFLPQSQILFSVLRKSYLYLGLRTFFFFMSICLSVHNNGVALVRTFIHESECWPLLSDKLS